MSISTSAHMKNAVKFEMNGSASYSKYYGVYPVITIDFRDREDAPSNSITLFPNVEQLQELQKQITAALLDVEILTAEMKLEREPKL